MKKSSRTDKYLVLLSSSLFVFLAAGVAALCLLGNSATVWIFSISELFGIVAAVAFFAYISGICVVSARKKGVRHYLLLSVEVMFTSIFLLGLSPVALVVWFVESVWDKITEKRDA